MKFIGDLHIHSHYSLATSKKLVPEYLDYWGRVKGIKVIGTGDFTHPGWIKELKEKLVPAEQGLFKLKDEYKIEQKDMLPEAPDTEIRFMLTAEISNIYKRGEKTRKIHNVVFAPHFEAVEKIQQALVNIGGNITSDGRPILGLDARDLLEIVIEASEDCFFVPAHIWTPWFSALGDKSGFNSIKECYRDLADHIYAVETGLSTDAPMHWMCSFLDNYTLISNSDAHSPQKLGRNANLFDTDLSYPSICEAISSGNPDKFLGTIDLYPQEGKYHYDGHRKCGIRWDPVETLKHNKICPKCRKPVTIGVMNRVVELSDRTNLEERPNRLPFHSIIPLKEILSEIEDVGTKTKTVARAYNPLIKQLGNESDILLNVPVEDIRKKGHPVLAEAIQRMRDRKVLIKEGFDGQYGEITVFQAGEVDDIRAGQSIFDNGIKEERLTYKSQNLLNFSLNEYRELEEKRSKGLVDKSEVGNEKKLNKEQKKAVEYTDGDLLIIAGPGTGKTYTLVKKIAYLINKENVYSGAILPIAFTNKAAREINDRLKQTISESGNQVIATTFHYFGLEIIKNNPDKFNLEDDFTIIDSEDIKFILKSIFDIKKKEIKKTHQIIQDIKQDIIKIDTVEKDTQQIFQRYEKFLEKNNLVDINDLLYKPFQLFKSDSKFLENYQRKYEWILIDEYQDVNPVQYGIIKLLSSAETDHEMKVCAIGDPNQAIYGFRGADVIYIKKFEEDFPDSQSINLKTSYRCSKNILNTSSKLFGSQEKQSLITGLKKGVRVRISDHKTEKSEAEFVARMIEQYMGGVRFFSIDSNITEGTENTGNNTPSDFAVLCRTKQQIPALEKAFNDHGLPYQSAGTQSFFKNKPISQFIKILKFQANPDNPLIKKQLIESSSLNKEDLRVIQDFKDHSKLKKSISQLVDRFYPEYKKRYKRKLQRFYDFARNYDDLNQFLKATTLSSGQDGLFNKTENIDIMTLHSSKGLEYKYVFIVGCEDQLLPYSLFDQESNFDEERRLLYVGMTRAESHLFLTHSKNRYINGMKFLMKPSPFIEEIEEDLKKVAKRNFKNKDKGKNQLSIF
ncbi:MAG TPA: UvrD-helicase domain-containing protein [bacterium]|nr:UvrD-helicase domain-containing protein [bacterium]